MDEIEISVRCNHPGCGELGFAVVTVSGPSQIRCSTCNGVLLDYTPIKGYVYVLSNENMPSLLKVGFTTRDVAQRVAELSASTGVPAPFILEAVFATADPETHERQIHQRLADVRLENREFFRHDLRAALQVMVAVCGSMPKYVRDPALLAKPKAPSPTPRAPDVKPSQTPTTRTRARRQPQTPPITREEAQERLAKWQDQAYRRLKSPG